MANKVTVYVLPRGCSQCTATKRRMDKKNISYETIDITQDASAYEYIKSLGFSAAPVVIAGEKSWSGFEPELIDTLAGE